MANGVLPGRIGCIHANFDLMSGADVLVGLTMLIGLVGIVISSLCRASC